MGLLQDTQNCGCACAGNAGNVFPVTAGKRSRHASRHVRHARAVMHVEIVNKRFLLKSAAGENVPGIPGACATCNFTYLVRGPYTAMRLQDFTRSYSNTFVHLLNRGRDLRETQLKRWIWAAVMDTFCLVSGCTIKHVLLPRLFVPIGRDISY